MEKITAFYLHECPYCANAKKAIGELIEENPAYKDIPLTWYEETENPDIVAGHVYEYVPNFFVGDKKVYENHEDKTTGNFFDVPDDDGHGNSGRSGHSYKCT